MGQDYRARFTSANANCFGFRLDVYDSAGQGLPLPLPAAMARSTVARIETMSSSCSSPCRWLAKVIMEKGKGLARAGRRNRCC